MVTMTDILPDTVTYSSAVPVPDYQSGQVVSWFVGADLPFVALILATVNNDGCESLSINTVDASWGCQSLGCTSGSKQETSSLVTEVEFDLPGWNQLSDFTTCGGLITFYVENDGATADDVNFIYTLPDSYYYDSSGGGAEITSSDPAHTFSGPEEEPVNLGGSPQQIEFSGVARGGNINNGNDYIVPDERLTFAFNVYREPSDLSCDTDPSSDPPIPVPVTGTVIGSFSNTCGTYVTDGIDFNAQTLTPDYADLDLSILPPTQIVIQGGSPPST